MIYIASDHRGYQLKEVIKKYLADQNIEIQDVGAFEFNQDDDYVDFARVASEKVAENPTGNKGILICGSGHGMDMVANKYKGVRAAMGFNAQVAAQSREHEDSNVLILPSDWLEAPAAEDIVSVWIGKQFSGDERHVRRLRKIEAVEERDSH